MRDKIVKIVCYYCLGNGERTIVRGRNFMNNLYRSNDERVIAGVCAGIALKLDLNVAGLRLVVALTTLFLSGVPVLVYLVLWAILKERSTKDVVDV